MRRWKRNTHPTQILVASLLLLLSVLWPAGCAKAPARLNVVLVILDTVRTDFTGVGHVQARDRSFTPNLDRLASNGLVFRNAWSPAPWTVPSHASMFTGLLPSQHGCDTRNIRFRPSSPTLAGVLSHAGYATCAFYSNPWLSERGTGLLRGFEVVEEAPFAGLMDRPGQAGGYQGGLGVLKDATAWLASRSGDEPFFMYVNFLEAHAPYDPPADYRHVYLADLPLDDVVSVPWIHEYNADLHPTSAVDWNRIRRLYAGDVFTADSLLARLMAALQEHGALDRTIVIITSDHGEHLGEHERLEHQFSVYEELLSVPFVVWAPDLVPSGVREDPILLSDLFATILDLAGIEDVEIPPGSKALLPGVGRPDNLSPASTDDPARPLFAEYAGPYHLLMELLLRLNPKLDTSDLDLAYHTVRVGSLRLTAASDGSLRLHDLERDPAQDHDRSAELPEETVLLKALLDHMLTGTPDLPGGEETALDEVTREKLRSLGYVR